MADYEKPSETCCHDSKKWKEMDITDKSDLRNRLNILQTNDLVGINEYNSLLYKWCFILNSGGLLGTITLISLKPRDDFIIYVYGVLIAFFLFGIISVILSNIFECSRLEKDQTVIAQYYNNFQEGKICQCYFWQNVGKEHNSPFWSVFMQRTSIVLFVIGILLGVGLLITNAKEYCANNVCTPHSANPASKR